MNRQITTIFAFLAITLMAASASADEMAALEVNIGKAVEANVRSDIEAAIKTGVESSGKFKYMSESTARAKITPVARDCYTDDCLKKAGDGTNAEAGIRVRFSGEAQIYDWTIDTFDLRTGKQLVSDKGACELCGRAEVERTFKKSITSVVSKTRVSTPKPKTVAKPDPKPDPEPESDPEPEVEENTETVAQNEPTGAGTRLEISLQPTDAEVFLDGQSLGTGDQSVTLEPGTYELRFAREGYQGFKESVFVGEESSPTTAMRVHMSKTDPDPVVVRSGDGFVDGLSSADRVVYGTISAVSGAAILTIGLWLSTLDGEAACGEGSFEECPEIWDTDGVAITSAVVGTGLILGGVALLAWDFLAGGDEEKSADEEGVDVAPAVGEDSVGIQLFGRF